MAYRNTVSGGTDHLCLPFPRLEGNRPKNPIAIISGTDKATDFKFGWYFHSAYPNKSQLNILESLTYSGTVQICSVHLLSQQRVKLRTSNFVCTFPGSIEQKSIKMSRKVAVGVVRDSHKFSGSHKRGASRSHLCDSSAFL